MTRNTVLVAAIVAALGLGAALWFTLEPADDQVAGRAAPSPASQAKPGDGGHQGGTQGQQPSSQTADAGGTTSEPAAAAPAGSETQMAAAPATPPAATQPAASPPAAAQPAAAAPADSAPAADPAPEPPSFDIVRVEKDGSAVIAGRAPAGSTITLLDGETPLGSAKAGADGSFALVLDQPLAPGSRALSLAATTSEGTVVPSTGEVVVMVPEAAPTTATTTATATATTDGAAAGAGTTAAQTASSETVVTEAAASDATVTATAADAATTGTQPSETVAGAAQAEGSSSESVITEASATAEASATTETSAITETAAAASATVPAAGAGQAASSEAVAPSTPLVVASSAEGASVVLQAPGGDLTGDTLRIEAVDYDLDGQVIVSGRAPAGSTVALYLNGGLLGQALAGADGRWVFTPDAPVAAGLHRLRADQLAADGSVVARAEIPFSRAEPLQLAANEDFVIVQPGNSLWVIARGKYGEGIRYSTIYQANAGQIRDPDLIYPGQIFLVPQVN